MPRVRHPWPRCWGRDEGEARGGSEAFWESLLRAASTTTHACWRMGAGVFRLHAGQTCCMCTEVVCNHRPSWTMLHMGSCGMLGSHAAYHVTMSAGLLNHHQAISMGSEGRTVQAQLRRPQKYFVATQPFAGMCTMQLLAACFSWMRLHQQELQHSHPCSCCTACQTSAYRESFPVCCGRPQSPTVMPRGTAIRRRVQCSCSLK